ncbi:MAG: hypothetical protein GC164_11625 [Phycisphaera sp.]|nr:hypothetical protein [Phycisphaera sp.]
MSHSQPTRRGKPATRSRAVGFTLMEVLIASTILAFSVAAITQAIVAGQTQSYEALHEYRALSLAEALMEEILAKPYDDPEGATDIGPDAGETTRALFDNVDDYHGYTEAAGTVADEAGLVYPAPFTDFSRSVTVSDASQGIAGLGVTLYGVTVTVTVTDERGRQWTIARFVQEADSVTEAYSEEDSDSFAQGTLGDSSGSVADSTPEDSSGVASPVPDTVPGQTTRRRRRRR